MKIVTNPDDVQPQALGVPAAAKYAGMSKDQLRRLIRSRRIPARHTGACYIISIKALDNFLAGADDPIGHRGSA